MNSKNRIIIAVVVVIVIAGAAVWYMVANPNKTAAPAASSNPSSSSSSNSTNNSTTQEIAATITYNGDSFSVSNDKVKSGSSVKVVNSSDKELDFDSDPHPVHTDNTELNEGDIAPGKSKTFTLTKTGTWGFHNHLDASQHGNITVE
jgi:plastocyanin